MQCFGFLALRGFEFMGFVDRASAEVLDGRALGGVFGVWGFMSRLSDCGMPNSA